MNNPIFVAIDKSDIFDALSLAKTVAPFVYGFKLGKEFLAACGIEGVRQFCLLDKPLFLDVKYHDIPHTVQKAIMALAPLKPFMINVHCSGGLDMLKASAAAKKSMDHPILLIGVTVLTSLHDDDLPMLGIQASAAEQALQLAKLAKTAGLDGVVCSAHEIKAIKQVCGRSFKTVVPGIRPAWASSDDQSRTMTPKQAMAQGADFLVMGRPITATSDPAAACQKLLEELV